MRVRIGFLTVLIGSLFVFFIAGNKASLTKQPQVNKAWTDPTTLSARVKKEKDKGARTVTFPAPVMEYPDADLSTSLSESTVVVADVTGKVSRLIDTHTIGTFYKLSVVETLSKPKSSVCCNPKDEDFPSDLPALSQGEMYMAGIGGTLTLDGVEVTVEEAFKDLIPYRRYVLFLKASPSGRLSVSALGPTGVFVVESDGRLESIVGKANKLRGDMKQIRNGSLEGLKQHIKQKN